MQTTAPDFTVPEKQKTSEVRHRTTLAEVKTVTHEQTLTRRYLMAS